MLRQALNLAGAKGGRHILIERIDIGDAEASWGIIPDPTVMREVIESPLTVPILVGAGIVAAALLLS